MPTNLAISDIGENFLDKISPGGKYYKYALGVLIGLGVILIGLVVAIFLPQFTGLFTPKPSPSPAAAAIARPPVLPLATGFQSWDVSYGPASTGPRVKNVTIDTLTPPKGGTQTSTLQITNDSAVSNVTATVYTDNQHHDYTLKLVKGTPTNGTWSGTWTISDTFDYIYHINYVFTSPTGGSDLAVTLR